MTIQQTVSSEDKLRRRLDSIGNLPTPPVVFTQISKVMNEPTTSVKEVAAIMSEDPAMSAKVLRLSNSAYFGVKNEITHIRQAIMVLGLDAIKALVLSSAVFDMFKDRKMDSEYQEAFWRHSLATAMAARILARQNRFSFTCDPEVAFSAGLLHDIGKLIICCFMPKDHERIRELIDRERYSDYQAEEQVIGFPHTLVGSLLGESWKLPQLIRKAIADHHAPNLDGDGGQYAALIHVANYLAVKTFAPEMLRQTDWPLMQPEIPEQMGLDQETLDEVAARLLDDYIQSSTFMQMAVSA